MKTGTLDVPIVAVSASGTGEYDPVSAASVDRKRRTQCDGYEYAEGYPRISCLVDLAANLAMPRDALSGVPSVREG